jgi:hypothetical protein
VRLGTEGADAAHAVLTSAGATVNQDVLRLDFAPPMFTFQDPDHNLLVLILEDEVEQSPSVLRASPADRLRRGQRHPSFGERRLRGRADDHLLVTHRDHYFNDGGHVAARHRRR